MDYVPFFGIAKRRRPASASVSRDDNDEISKLVFRCDTYSYLSDLVQGEVHLELRSRPGSCSDQVTSDNSQLVHFMFIFSKTCELRELHVCRAPFFLFFKLKRGDTAFRTE